MTSDKKRGRKKLYLVERKPEEDDVAVLYSSESIQRKYCGRDNSVENVAVVPDLSLDALSHVAVHTMSPSVSPEATSEPLDLPTDFQKLLFEYLSSPPATPSLPLPDPSTRTLQSSEGTRRRLLRYYSLQEANVIFETLLQTRHRLYDYVSNSTI
jgi:hypothetical protein